MNRGAGACLWIAFAVVLSLFMAALLVGLRAPAAKQSEYCVANLVSASPHFGVSINCDAFALLNLAREPARLLEPNNRRQSRPMMVMPAWALRPLFLWSIDAPKHLGIAPAQDMREYYQQYMPEFLAKDFPGFMAYALFNVLTRVTIFAVYLWLVLGNVSGRGWDAASALSADF